MVQTISEMDEALAAFREEEHKRKRTSVRSKAEGKEHGVLGLFRKGVYRPHRARTLLNRSRCRHIQGITTSRRI